MTILSPPPQQQEHQKQFQQQFQKQFQHQKQQQQQHMRSNSDNWASVLADMEGIWMEDVEDSIRNKLVDVHACFADDEEEENLSFFLDSLPLPSNQTKTNEMDSSSYNNTHNNNVNNNNSNVNVNDDSTAIAMIVDKVVPEIPVFCSCGQHHVNVAHGVTVTVTHQHQQTLKRIVQMPQALPPRRRNVNTVSLPRVPIVAFEAHSERTILMQRRPTNIPLDFAPTPTLLEIGIAYGFYYKMLRDTGAMVACPHVFGTAGGDKASIPSYFAYAKGVQSTANHLVRLTDTQLHQFWNLFIESPLTEALVQGCGGSVYLVSNVRFHPSHKPKWNPQIQNHMPSLLSIPVTRQQLPALLPVDHLPTLLECAVFAGVQLAAKCLSLAKQWQQQASLAGAPSWPQQQQQQTSSTRQLLRDIFDQVSDFYLGMTEEERITVILSPGCFKE